MKTQRMKQLLMSAVLFLSTSLFIGCNKDDGNSVLVGQRPGITHNRNCTNCPIQTNKLVDAIGIVGPGVMSAEIGVGFYTDSTRDNTTNVVGQIVSMEGYIYVDYDHNSFCFLREGHYRIETITAGTVNPYRNIEGLVAEGVHVGTGERVSLSFPFLGYATLTPERISQIDKHHYAHYLNGQMVIGQIDGPQVNCNANALYLIGKPY